MTNEERDRADGLYTATEFTATWWWMIVTNIIGTVLVYFSGAGIRYPHMPFTWRTVAVLIWPIFVTFVLWHRLRKEDPARQKDLLAYLWPMLFAMYFGMSHARDVGVVSGF